MAAIASPRAAGGGSIKTALIVFVVLTVLSLGGMIFAFTYYSDLQAREAEARSQLDSANRNLRNTEDQLQQFSLMTIGAASTDIPKIRQTIDEVRKQVENAPALKEANVSLSAEMDLLTMLKGLLNQYNAQAERLKSVVAERDRLSSEREQALIKTAEAAQKQYADKTAELEKKYKELEQTAAKDRDAWQQQVESLTAQLEKASEAASAQLTGVRQQMQTIAQQRDEAQARVKELVATLASFRPQADLTSALQIADGQVVRAVAGENIVYVSLGERDGLTRGISFAVYSRTGGIPADGKGKATILVEQVFATTAECRVTSSTPSDPIIEGDLVANPVFDKTRRLNFVVAGDFDLNFDGRIDDPGGVEVARLIAQAGGNVVKTVDTRTDFVVLGAPPPAPAELGANETAEARERAAKQAAEREVFDKMVQEAKALSIPVLSRTQFLQFIGIKVPKNAPADQLPI